MKALVCEMCGSQDIVKTDGYYVCQCCGTKYSPEEAKKLVIEGTIKIDNSDKLSNLFDAARNAKDVGNYAQAKIFYTEILSLEPNSWEALYYSVYCTVAECRIIQIESAANALKDCLQQTFYRIVIHEKNKESAVKEVTMATIAMATTLHDAALQHLNSSANENATSYDLFTPWLGEYMDRTKAVANVLYLVGNLVMDTSKELALCAWKQGVVYISNFYRILDEGYQLRKALADNIKVYGDKIKEFEPTYSLPDPDYSIYSNPIRILLRRRIQDASVSTDNSSSGGCYIATAVYGSYDCPQVWTLRRFRDHTLAESLLGRAFVRAYYATSPSLVKWFGDTKWFNQMWKASLDCLIEQLNKHGVEDTPYEDIVW